MDLLTVEQRLVLFAVWVSKGGNDARNVASLTLLTRAVVESSLTQLDTADCIRQVSEDDPPHYTADLLDGVPLVPSWDRWLAEYCDAFPPFVDRDAEATTFCSCGVVLLTAVLASTKNADLIAHVTTFPRAFVQKVIDLADEDAVWLFHNVLDLRHRLLRTAPLSEIEKTLDVVKEDFCMAKPFEDSEALEYLREGRQFGGKMDDWPEAEDIRNTE